MGCTGGEDPAAQEDQPRKLCFPCLEDADEFGQPTPRTIEYRKMQRKGHVSPQLAMIPPIRVRHLCTPQITVSSDCSADVDSCNRGAPGITYRK
ncbi:hypothetical protein E4U41_006434 [Claviceps citrina]|nr:hypothetical protein E4U41_006434 [Claviceps citrina]